MVGEVSVVGFLRVVFMLFLKDLLVEVRRVYELVSVSAFPLAGSLVFSLLGGGSGSGFFVFVFIIMLLSSFFITTTSFLREYEKGTIYGLRSLPFSSSVFFASKVLFTLFMVVVSGFLTVFFSGVFAGFPSVGWLGVFLLFFLFALNLSVISSLVSCVTMYAEGRYVLVPFLILVFSFPVVILSSSVVGSLVAGLSVFRGFLYLFLHFLAFLVFSLVLSEFVVEE